MVSELYSHSNVQIGLQSSNLPSCQLHLLSILILKPSSNTAAPAFEFLTHIALIATAPVHRSHQRPVAVFPSSLSTLIKA